MMLFAAPEWKLFWHQPPVQIMPACSQVDPLVPTLGCTPFPLPISVSDFPTRRLECRLSFIWALNVLQLTPAPVVPYFFPTDITACHADGVPVANKDIMLSMMSFLVHSDTLAFLVFWSGRV